MERNVNAVYQATLLVVENRETKEFNAFFAQLPMTIGKGKTKLEAIVELLALSQVISRSKNIMR